MIKWRKWQAHNILVRMSEGKRQIEDLGVDGKIILKCILRRVGCRLCTDMTLNRNRWRSLVDTLMNLPVPRQEEISWTDALTLIFLIKPVLHGISSIRKGHRWKWNSSVPYIDEKYLAVSNMKHAKRHTGGRTRSQSGVSFRHITREIFNLHQQRQQRHLVSHAAAVSNVPSIGL
jgi:hypothetical protein